VARKGLAHESVPLRSSGNGSLRRIDDSPARIMTRRSSPRRYRRGAGARVGQGVQQIAKLALRFLTVKPMASKTSAWMSWRWIRIEPPAQLGAVQYDS